MDLGIGIREMWIKSWPLLTPSVIWNRLFHISELQIYFIKIKKTSELLQGVEVMVPYNNLGPHYNKLLTNF